MIRLRNGIPVFLTKVPGANKFALYLGVTAGSAYEPQDKQGIAHLTEHMVFTTTSAFTSQELIKQLEWHGIDTNAMTSYGTVKVFLHGPARFASYAVEILFKVAQLNDYTQAEFVKEQQIVIEELRSYRNLPSEHLSNWVLEPKLLHGSLLANSILGTEQTLKSITLQDIKDWKSNTYVPDNFAISIAGNFDETQVLESLEKTFGSLPKASKNNTFPPQRPQPLHGQYIQYRSGIDQAYLHQGYLAPCMADQDFPAVLLLNYILDGGMSSRVFQEIREKKSLGYVAGFRYIKEYGFCFFFLDGCSPSRLKEAQHAFTSIVQSLHDIPEDEFVGMRTLLEAHLDDKLRSEDDIARKTLDAFAYESEFTYPKIKEAISSITSDDIKKAARKIFGEKPVQAILLPNEQET